MADETKAPETSGTGAETPKAPAAKAKKADAPEMTRREFNWLALAWSFFAASAGAGLTAMGRFMFPNVLTEPPSSFKVGFPADFAVGAVDERFKEKFRVWVVRNEEGMYALSAICTHLGCTPNWLSAENKFKCPCHGSGFYMSGINFEGPAPRPLERVKIALADDGQVLIDKGRLFKQEAGQWNDPESFLSLS
jgi:cytochrome b6-f complex iron-sulfur subunit